ncbi:MULTISPECIES: hypothetical protein [unclassified Variovorax]|jgi:hypothetical protein|uniref:hypothetical protein n=1 Tax=unclassified Variovorax TaxID=663243 RepID=UPI0008D6E491|nr:MULTISPECIES: hypothetical protein [unclassified Variovorax]SEK15167.1 hypothetical protein SAMN05518853_116145 [Variovorax sp. OK202]SFE09783.1 hypothetical protein SAMN05444746_116145 [Variovorax sp. OK212]
MAERIMARASGPTSPDGITPSDAWDLLENRLEQLNALLLSFYGNMNGWFEEVGPDRRDRLLWIASDLAQDAAALFQRAAKS